MKGRIGVPTHTRLVSPELISLRPIANPSKAARLRMQWLDYYFAHGRNGALVCRRFGISRSCFFKWRRRLKLQGLYGLEDVSTRPRRVRFPLTPNSVIDTVRALRRSNPELSKYKLAVILRRDYGYSISASTIGRIISRYQLFFKPLLNRRSKRYEGNKMRKPKRLAALKPGDLIEVDVKHLPSSHSKLYSFVAIDVVTKQATVHVASSISSYQAAIAWRKTVARLGLPQSVVTDNGSENLGAFAKLLQEQKVTHYFARPYTPKDKPHVERFIGTLERECIQWGGAAFAIPEQQSLIDTWLNKYHDYRPHQALGYLTPNEYRAKLGLKVSSML